jgi:hypothetical protein
MDGPRFDTITRTLTQSGFRRRALAAALVGALGLRGIVRPDAATAGGKCKPKCAECKKCKKGKNGKKGKCKPQADGAGCSTGTCQGGDCVAPPPSDPCPGQDDFTPCGGGKSCSGGVCATPPGCLNGPSCSVNANCCSLNCPGGGSACTRSSTGQPCGSDSDCLSVDCVGFKCQA